MKKLSIIIAALIILTLSGCTNADTVDVSGLNKFIFQGERYEHYEGVARRYNGAGYAVAYGTGILEVYLPDSDQIEDAEFLLSEFDSSVKATKTESASSVKRLDCVRPIVNSDGFVYFHESHPIPVDSETGDVNYWIADVMLATYGYKLEPTESGSNKFQKIAGSEYDYAKIEFDYGQAYLVRY